MFGIGTGELIVIGIIAVILFGGRLPSVARSLGKSLVEFKKGMSDLENEVKSSVYSEPDRRISHEESEPTSPRFEPPKSGTEEASREKNTDDVA